MRILLSLLPLLLLMLLCGGALPCCAQLSLSQMRGATGLPKAASDGIRTLNGKALSCLSRKYEKLDGSLEKQSQKMLARLQRKEGKLRKKLAAKDSLTARQLFDGGGREIRCPAGEAIAAF